MRASTDGKPIIMPGLLCASFVLQIFGLLSVTSIGAKQPPHCKGAQTAPLRFNGAVRTHLTGSDTRYIRAWDRVWALPPDIITNQSDLISLMK